MVLFQYTSKNYASPNLERAASQHPDEPKES
jgi:hypothetical protein